MTEKTFNDDDCYEWFNSYAAEFWFELSANKESTLPKERSFLYRLGILRNQDSLPTVKQMNWAKKILGRIGVQTVDNTMQSRPIKEDNNMGAPEIKHATVRMAWHDNRWNGSVCKYPDKNEYCIGEYSLLSSRIRHRRKLDKECPMELADLEKLDGYIPPCYWSINAWGETELTVEHEHPMLNNPNIAGTPNIPDKLLPHSVFTWPFKLSFVRDSKLKKKDGQYPKNLEARIDRFFSQLKPGESIVFLYCNYDNPISGDEQKYLIVGCALLKEIGGKHHYDIPSDGLTKIRQKKGFQNFPTVSWEVLLTMDPENMVRLPYHEYLEDAEQTNDYDLLNEIKVTVDEPEIMQNFKYVAMDIDDDQTIYLLTKMKKTLLKVKEHGRFNDVYDTDGSLRRIENFLKHAWQKRGMFPGFFRLSRFFLNKNPGDIMNLDGLLDDLRIQHGEQYYEELLKFIDNPSSNPSLVTKYEDEIHELKETLATLKITTEYFLRLATLNLIPEQFSNFINSKDGKVKQSISEICANPYLLYEEYECEVGKNDENPATGERIDAPIELFRVDIACFPDINYLKRFHRIQSFSPADPKRVRALVMEYLRGLEQSGDCFDYAGKIEAKLEEYPLFYKTDYFLPADVLTNPSAAAKEHFEDKLVIIKDDHGNPYYYLKSVYDWEQLIEAKIKALLSLPDLSFSRIMDIQDSIGKLKELLGDKFDEEEFSGERRYLYNNIFKKRMFVLSGSPGTGKSYELLNIVETLRQAGEKYLILTPTGKAVLRLTLNDEGFENIEAQTIDRFLWTNKDASDNSIPVENLIIDEMSMIDLRKFTELFQKLNFDPSAFRRFVLVGDENQLPPIGFGKVFIDVIRYLLSNQQYENNYVSLNVNCRQKFDSKVVEFSKIFSGQNKNYEPMFASAMRGGKVSEGLDILYWKNRDELRMLITRRFKELFKDDLIGEDLNLSLNKVFNLYESGYVNNTKYMFYSTLRLDNFQIIAPYRAAYYGALGLNNFIQSEFRGEQVPVGKEFPFRHSDKIIQTKNLYIKEEGLILSNGSLGIVVKGPGFYFPERKTPTYLSNLDRESLELAYAITVHKSQGSGFEHVFFVLPAKKGLLTRELVYTALTRSKRGVSVFVYGESGQKLEDSIFEQARTTSSTETRKTSLLGAPFWEYSLSPSKDIKVKSRAEYIIYKKLEELKEQLGGFTFKYEEIYSMPNRGFDIKPDFVIKLQSEKKIYWEHLGKLTDRSYLQGWRQRLKMYKEEGLIDRLVTTDEIRGIDNNKIEDVILDIATDALKSDTSDGTYSEHHYHLG